MQRQKTVAEMSLAELRALPQVPGMRLFPLENGDYHLAMDNFVNGQLMPVRMTLTITQKTKNNLLDPDGDPLHWATEQEIPFVKYAEQKDVDKK